MKTLSTYINENKVESDDNVYVVYYDDGTMYDYYMTEEEANKVASKLTKENSDFPASVKKELKTNFESK